MSHVWTSLAWTVSHRSLCLCMREGKTDRERATERVRVSISTMCLFVCVCLCVSISVFTCLYTSMCLHLCACMHSAVCVFITVSMCQYGCMCIHVCACTRVCVCMHSGRDTQDVKSCNRFQFQVSVSYVSFMVHCNTLQNDFETSNHVSYFSYKFQFHKSDSWFTATHCNMILRRHIMYHVSVSKIQNFKT